MCGKSKKLLACLPVKVEVNAVKTCAGRTKRKNVCAERLATLTTTLASLFGWQLCPLCLGRACCVVFYCILLCSSMDSWLRRQCFIHTLCHGILTYNCSREMPSLTWASMRSQSCAFRVIRTCLPYLIASSQNLKSSAAKSIN
jgi:hypothetical protein